MTRQIRSNIVRSRGPKDAPNLDLALSAVAERVISAAVEASKALRRADVDHALVGGLAVAAYGYPRATRDVDFVIGDSGFEEHGNIVTLAPGVPIGIGDVPVDVLPIRDDESHLLEALNRAESTYGVPVLPLEALIYMKLDSGRRKDLGDVAELLDLHPSRLEAVKAYLQEHAPELLEVLHDAIDA